ncbi:MAG: BACON domain-containing protein [Methylococcales bacterium]
MTPKQGIIAKSNNLVLFTALTILSSLTVAPAYAAAPKISGCDIFPANNIWNTPIKDLPVHQSSTAWVASIGAGAGLHMDFAAGKWEGKEIGIPYNVVAASKEPKQPFTFLYADESDAGQYPINSTFKIEEGSDHHLLTLDTETCKLYEVFNTSNANGWKGDSGAIWDLKSNALRPIGWTSADAAGLPVLPGLVRYEEVEAGAINHAIRFTMQRTNSYVWPGTHLTSGKPGVLTNTPPLGARFRLKADFDISPFDPKLQVILQAMKTYGIINADNGGNWFISGAPDPRWNDELLSSLSKIKGSAFEAVDESCLMVSSSSAEANPSQCAALSKDRPVINAATPNLAGCQIFPADNVWNTPIDQLPLHVNSAQYIANIGRGTSFHTDFASGTWNGAAIGIPYNAMDTTNVPKYTFNFLYQEDSDTGPYPIAANSKIEEGSDHHLITVDTSKCKVYEIFNARQSNGWQGDSGAVFDLTSNTMRPNGLTSADAAGLPILPGLVRYEEIASGAINHAIRFTVEKTHGSTWPGSHVTRGQVGQVYTDQPPLGARLRLKANYDISKFAPELQVILKAMKTYGIILADNGSNWFLSGVTDARWNDDILSGIDRLKGDAFEVVDESCLMVSASSYQADLSKCDIPRDRPVPPPVAVGTGGNVTAAACTYTLSMDSKRYSASGGIGSVSVTPVGSNCEWTAKSNTPWIPIYVQTLKNSSKRVIFAVARNRSNAPRTGTITIADKVFSVEQAK